MICRSGFCLLHQWRIEEYGKGFLVPEGPRGVQLDLPAFTIPSSRYGSNYWVLKDE